MEKKITCRGMNNLEPTFLVEWSQSTRKRKIRYSHIGLRMPRWDEFSMTTHSMTILNPWFSESTVLGRSWGQTNGLEVTYTFRKLSKNFERWNCHDQQIYNQLKFGNCHRNPACTFETISWTSHWLSVLHQHFIKEGLSDIQCSSNC